MIALACVCLWLGLIAIDGSGHALECVLLWLCLVALALVWFGNAR
jgi:hypothetical protein